jgi:3-dehydroquinate dehydratase II
MKILIINGPNLNLINERETMYGEKSLEMIISITGAYFQDHNIELSWFQSNEEGVIVEKIHDVIHKKYDGLIINPGAFSHYSISIMDALKIVKMPKIEVHLTNTLKRETFRRKKVTAKAVDFILIGLGDLSYRYAIDILINKNKETECIKQQILEKV